RTFRLGVPMPVGTGFRGPWSRSIVAAALLASILVSPARAWLYDTNHNRIDDRIEAVNANGLTAAYEHGDLSRHKLIGASAGPPIRYKVYVGYDHHPNLVDTQALALRGAVVLTPFRYIDYVLAE